MSKNVTIRMPLAVGNARMKRGDDPEPVDAIVRLDNYTLVEMDGQVLVGDCNQCGKCCGPDGVPPFPNDDGICKYLISDQVNEQGKRIYRCEIYRRRPVSCALYPELDDPVPDECSLSWEPKGIVGE
jgi:hypothetical protein